MKDIPRGKPAATKNTAPKTLQALARLMTQYPEVQLATLVDQPPPGSQWIHEIKVDRYRLLGFVAGGEARLRTRKGNDWTSSFPSIAAALRKLKAVNVVLDMEDVIVDAEGKTSFQALQAALGDGGRPEGIVAYAFDLLHLDGENLTTLPLIERKKKLEALLKKSKPGEEVRYSEHVEVEGAAIHARACENGLEGIISKLAGAPYVFGRQKSWLKIKCALRQEFIIVGYSAAKSGSRALGALYLGYRKSGVLHYAGKVGTGFTMKSARDLVNRFDEIPSANPVLTRKESPGMGAGEWAAVHWVQPVMLCEVSFTEWTDDGRIRHPSFQGLRMDKSAAEVKQEKPMPVSVSKAAAAKPKARTLVAAGITHLMAMRNAHIQMRGPTADWPRGRNEKFGSGCQ